MLSVFLEVVTEPLASKDGAYKFFVADYVHADCIAEQSSIFWRAKIARHVTSVHMTAFLPCLQRWVSAKERQS